MHCSRPYHPQSKGKIERSHRELRKKIHYDMINQARKKRVNWVQNIFTYMRVLNKLAMEELPWKNPFEVYYRKIPNNIQNAGRYTPKQVTVDEKIIDLPSARNLQKFLQNEGMCWRSQLWIRVRILITIKSFFKCHTHMVFLENITNVKVMQKMNR